MPIQFECDCEVDLPLTQLKLSKVDIRTCSSQKKMPLCICAIPWGRKEPNLACVVGTPLSCQWRVQDVTLRVRPSLLSQTNTLYAPTPNGTVCIDKKWHHRTFLHVCTSFFVLIVFIFKYQPMRSTLIKKRFKLLKKVITFKE